MSESPVLSTRDVQITRGGQALVFPDLTVAQGSRCLILGASGKGKSTLLGIIAGLLNPDVGQVTVVGQSMNDLKGAAKDHFRAQHLGVVFQTLNLLPFLTVRQNLQLAASFKKKNANQPWDEWLERINLPSVLIDREVRYLSVGQQQRVAVLRAGLGSPDLVLADEPTSALDKDNSDRVLDVLFQAQTLLMVSHDERHAQYFDQVIRL